MKKINKMQICAIGLCIFLVTAVFSTAANGQNEHPITSDDKVTMNDNEISVTITILDNDEDLDGFLDPGSVEIVQDPSQGNVSVDYGTGDVTYKRTNVFIGQDTFDYTVDDNEGAKSNIATVIITVITVQKNAPPVANDDEARMECNAKSVQIEVLNNDFDKEDGTPKLDEIIKPPEHGEALISGDEIQYIPKDDFSGIDIFVYQVIDSGGLTDTANVSVTVEPCHENKPPIAENDTATMNESEKSIIIEVLKNDYDPDGDIEPTTVKIVDHPLYGKVCVDIIEGEVKYTRNADPSARSDKFTYIVNDTEGAKSNIATVTIIFKQGSENNLPVAENDYVKTDEDAEGTFDVLENDFDIDGDRLKIVDVSEPYHGKAEIITVPTETSNNANQKILYTPDRDYNGEDEFEYTISDGHGGEDTAIVYINIAPVNDLPYTPSNPNPADGAMDINIDVDLNWYCNDPDPGDTLTYDVYFGIASSPLLVSSNQSAIIYDPGTMNYEETYYWKIIAWDNHGAYKEGLIWDFATESAPPNYKPVFLNENPTHGSTGISVTLSSLSILIEDPEGDSFDWSITTSPDMGSSSGTGEYNGSKTCAVSGLDFNTVYTWYVNATDGGSGNTSSEVYMFTTEVNNPPNTPSSPSPSDGATDVDINADLSWYCNDPDPGDTLTYDVYFGITSSPLLVSSNQSAIIYDPGTMNYEETYYWKIIAWDSNSASTEGLVWNFTTENAPSGGDNAGGSGGTTGGVSNSPPVADASAGEPYQGFVDEELTFDGSLSFDSDGSIVSWSWNFGDGNIAYGEITTHTYSSPKAYLVTLTVTDDKGATDTCITTVAISQPNRPPSGPDIYGPETCIMGTKYSYAALSKDLDGDNIKYVFDWDDGNTDESEFLSLQRSYAVSFIHSWSSAGNYTIIVTVSDNQTVSSSEISVVVIEPSYDYTAVIILGSIMAFFVILSLILVKIGIISKFGKK